MLPCSRLTVMGSPAGRVHSTARNEAPPISTTMKMAAPMTLTRGSRAAINAPSAMPLSSDKPYPEQWRVTGHRCADKAVAEAEPGKPVNNQPRTHSASTQQAGMYSINRAAAEPGRRACR